MERSRNQLQYAIRLAEVVSNLLRKLNVDISSVSDSIRMHRTYVDEPLVGEDRDVVWCGVVRFSVVVANPVSWSARDSSNVDGTLNLF